MTTGDIMRALRKRYAPPGWSFLEEVRNKTGHIGGPERYADGLAMGLWPSHGLNLHGFEVKSSRSDWVRERNDPAKSEPISAYCDHWWLVVSDAKIVKDGELPPMWGMMELSGGKLITIKEAPKLEPRPLTRSFLAALLRRATEYQESWVPRVDVEQVVEERAEKRLEEKLRLVNEGFIIADHKRKSEILKKISEDMGVPEVSDYSWPHLKKAYDLVTKAEYRTNFRLSLENAGAQAKRVHSDIKKLLADLEVVDTPDEE